ISLILLSAATAAQIILDSSGIEGDLVAAWAEVSLAPAQHSSSKWSCVGATNLPLDSKEGNRKTRRDLSALS
ncbi:MAG: hypothetical protein ACXW6R_24465, partial [Candidatus Binatia bacterium]